MPYTHQDVAFELYIRNWNTTDIATATGENPTRIETWIEDGNWPQLREELDMLPYLRDIGWHKMAPPQLKQKVMELIGNRVMENISTSSRLITLAEQLFQPMPFHLGNDGYALN